MNENQKIPGSPPGLGNLKKLLLGIEAAEKEGNCKGAAKKY